MCVCCVRVCTAVDDEEVTFLFLFFTFSIHTFTAFHNVLLVCTVPHTMQYVLNTKTLSVYSWSLSLMQHLRSDIQSYFLSAYLASGSHSCPRMDFLSFIFSACLSVMGCCDLTPQNAADFGGISTSLYLSTAENYMHNLLPQNGFFLSSQVSDVQFLKKKCTLVKDRCVLQSF